MAKIVVFSDAILDTPSRTHFSRQVVNHAAETANEIYFVTQNDKDSELIGYHPKVQILRAFRKWNFIEAAKLLPVLFQIKADIFHFIQPQKKIGLSHAFPILAAFAKTINTQNILSLIDFDPKLSPGLEAMIAASQLVSVIDPSQAAPIQTRFRRLEIECLPARAFQDSSSLEEFEDPQETTYIFLPENFDQYDQAANLIRVLVAILKSFPEMHLVCSGSLLDFDLKKRREIMQSLAPIGSKVQWTGPLSRKKKISYLKSAHAVVFSGLRFSPHLIHENLGLALAAQANIIMTTRQVATSQLPIQNNVHAKVIEESQTESALKELLSTPEIRKLMRNNLAQLKQLHSEDELGNRLSRMYTKILS